MTVAPAPKATVQNPPAPPKSIGHPTGAIVAFFRGAKMQLPVESQRPAATPDTAASVLARAGQAAAVLAILSAVVVALLVQTAEARSRDFAAPPVTDAAPLPRSGPVSLSFALGANYLFARWREYDPSLGTRQSTNGGPAIQLRFGVPIRERVALFIQGDLSLLVIPGNSPWLGMSGFGVGATVFLPESRWYLEAGMRRASAGTITDVGVQRRIPLVASIDGIWFGEIGLGHATRRARVDSGPALSLFGGLMNPDGSSGWGIGTSLLYRWARY